VRVQEAAHEKTRYQSITDNFFTVANRLNTHPIER
jgi:hypothetical protein